MLFKNSTFSVADIVFFSSLNVADIAYVVKFYEIFSISLSEQATKEKRIPPITAKNKITEIIFLYTLFIKTPNKDYALLKIFIFSLASSIEDIMSITILTIMFEYPIPFTPRFKDMDRFDTRNVSHNKLNISLAIVSK